MGSTANIVQNGLPKEDQEEMVLPKNFETSNLRVEKSTLLSTPEYNIFHIFQFEKKIGCFGVFPDGKFQHVLFFTCENEFKFLRFIEEYIQTELKLTPICISRTF